MVAIMGVATMPYGGDRKGTLLNFMNVSWEGVHLGLCMLGGCRFLLQGRRI